MTEQQTEQDTATVDQERTVEGHDIGNAMQDNRDKWREARENGEAWAWAPQGDQVQPDKPAQPSTHLMGPA